MNFKTNLLLFLTCISFTLKAQSIKGTFPQIKNNEILLSGFSGFATKELAKTTTDSLGNFELRYPAGYVGAALLEAKDVASVIVLLNNENFAMQWEDVKDFKTLKFTNSAENEAFSNAVTINQAAESKLNGLKYLLPQYEKLPVQYKWLQEEIADQEQQFTNFVNQLHTKSYTKEYLIIRKLITDFPLTANRYIERMPQHEKDFNALNFNDNKLYTSGLVKELLEGYFKLMESHIEPKDMYVHINTSIDAILKSLSKNSVFQQEVAQHLYHYFEENSLFPAAEYLSLQMLNQYKDQLSEKSTNLFEQYRKLAVGKTAPNIFNLKDNNNLKNIKSNYKLVVFGQSDCPACQTDYPTLKEKYSTLKEKYDLEIVYISIDTDKAAFEAYYKDAPFITFCDAKGWETQAAKDYFVFATPTAILLDKDLKILTKIKHADHAEAWLNVNVKKK